MSRMREEIPGLAIESAGFKAPEKFGAKLAYSSAGAVTLSTFSAA